MKKIGKMFTGIALACSLASAPIISGCGADKLTLVEVSQDKNTYVLGEDFTVDGKTLVFKNKKGELVSYEINSDMLVEAPDMNTAGDKQVKVKYNNEEYTFTINVRERTNAEAKEALTAMLSKFQDGSINFANASLAYNINARVFSERTNIQDEYKVNLDRPSGLGEGMSIYHGEREKLAYNIYDGFMNAFIKTALSANEDDILNTTNLKTVFNFETFASKLKDEFVSNTEFRTTLFNSIVFVDRTTFIQIMQDAFKDYVIDDATSLGRVGIIAGNLYDDLKGIIVGDDYNVDFTTYYKSILNLGFGVLDNVPNKYLQALSGALKYAVGKQNKFTLFGDLTTEFVKMRKQENKELLEYVNSSEYYTNEEREHIRKANEAAEQLFDKLVELGKDLDSFIVTNESGELLSDLKDFAQAFIDGEAEFGYFGEYHEDISAILKSIDVDKIISAIESGTIQIDDDDDDDTYTAIKSFLTQIAFDYVDGIAVFTETNKKEEIETYFTDPLLSIMVKDGVLTFDESTFKKIVDAVTGALDHFKIEYDKDMLNYVSGLLDVSEESLLEHIENKLLSFDWWDLAKKYISEDSPLYSFTAEQVKGIYSELQLLAMTGCVSTESTIYPMLQLEISEGVAKLFALTTGLESDSLFFTAFSNFVSPLFDSIKVTEKENGEDKIYYDFTKLQPAYIFDSLFTFIDAVNDNLDEDSKINYSNYLKEILTQTDISFMEKLTQEFETGGILKAYAETLLNEQYLLQWISYQIASFAREDVEFETAQSVAYNTIAQYLTMYIDGIFKPEEFASDAVAYCQRYLNEDINIVVNSLMLAYSIYKGEDVDYNEMFASIPLPQGISIDYNEMMKKITDRATFENAITISDITSTLKVVNGECKGEIISVKLNINLNMEISELVGSVILSFELEK